MRADRHRVFVDVLLPLSKPQNLVFWKKKKTEEREQITKPARNQARQQQQQQNVSNREM